MPVLDEGFGVYIHWPFCLSKCPYCDFNSYDNVIIEENRLLQSYLKQLEYFFSINGNSSISSIYFGGGTPSLMSPETVESIIKTIDAKDAEITLEANPATENRFKEFHDAGVNRISLGIQALNDKDLRFLGRRHNLAEALKAIENAKKVFGNISLDFIYTRPEQSIADWEKELEQIMRFDVPHLSLYQLSIEEGTAFYGKVQPVDEGKAVDFYEATRSFLSSYGYENYEVSNYAKGGKYSRHNMTYWLGGDYIGVGAGAHGRVTQGGITTAWEQEKNPEKWLEMVESGDFGETEKLIPHERGQELVIMGLRLRQGIDKTMFKRLCGLGFEDVADMDKVQDFADEGLLVDSLENIRVTDKGFLLLNYIIAGILSI